MKMEKLTVFREEDASLEILKDKTVAVIGYGNQGGAQALNLRDSGVSVVIAGIRDNSAEKAEEDGFEVWPIKGCAKQAEVLMMLLPDEVQRRVYESELAPDLRAGNALCFAHGYNFHFGLIKPPPEADVFMVAPRMIGKAVRESFLKGGGAPAYGAVGQDGSGKAKDLMLAIAKGIGATRAGVFETTFEMETVLDLFMEQAFFPIFAKTILTAQEVLAEVGIDPRIAALEMYGSGEVGEVFKASAELGFLKQLTSLHSHTAQYGVLSRTKTALSEPLREGLRKSFDYIKSGAFAREWAKEEEEGFPRYKALLEEARRHPLYQADEALAKLLKKTEEG